MDKTDQRIMECLKKEGVSNQQRLINCFFAREGMPVFRRRLIELREKKIIKIEKINTNGVFVLPKSL